MRGTVAKRIRVLTRNTKDPGLRRRVKRAWMARHKPGPSKPSKYPRRTINDVRRAHGAFPSR